MKTRKMHKKGADTGFARKNRGERGSFGRKDGAPREMREAREAQAPRAAGPSRHAVRTFREYDDDAFGAVIRGRLALARSGVGFVTPEAGGDDVLVPSASVGAALPGDLVELRLLPPERGDSRVKGRVVRVVERSRRDVVCTLRRTGRHWTAVPIGAFGDRTFHLEDAGTARENDRIVVRFRDWENPTFNPDAELVAVIGPASTPSLDTETVIREHNLRTDFPEAVLAEAGAVSRWLDEPGPREDLRDLCIVTIDPDTARDYDDALSLTRDAEGRRVLGVHIADVSHFVRPGSALDAEAFDRGTSAYLIDTVLPMLPEQLSNGVCSLVQGEDRLAFSAFLTFDAKGRPVARRFAKSVMKSRRRMTYGEAMRVLSSHGEGPAEVPAEVRKLVCELSELSQQLRAARMARFSLDLTSPELEVQLDDEGRMTGIAPAEHNIAHELVEEAMIAANEAVAAEVAAHKIPHLARFHDAPDPTKLEDLQAALEGLGLHTGALDGAGALVRVLKAVRDTPLEYYVSTLVLRSMKRAEYSADREGHFGLAKRYYSHFTSPIRRYPDLVMHRQLAALLAGDRAAQPSMNDLRSIAHAATAAEFNTAQAERELVEMKKYRFLEETVDGRHENDFPAVVVAVQPFGAFVELPTLQVSGMVHVSQLAPAFLTYDSFRGALTAPGLVVAPGSRMRVAVTDVDYDRRRVDFRVRDLEKAPPKAPVVNAKQEAKNAKAAERKERRAKDGARREKGGKQRTQRKRDRR